MFGTWKYDPETDQVQNLRRAYDPITARSSQHQACNRCHEKKFETGHFSGYQQGGWSGFDDAAVAVSTTAMNSTYVATTSSPMYGNEYAAYDPYQGYQYPNMDQRYWTQ
ncbi:fungal zn(2)-Cys(6) binuclear cluster domain-containing protein [Purpureocillium lavendulum]|uniref:Fungal zn(2)-Cys(6) binuclear cluster domain-containing protein n=1 Tax=Purpureocillium lavendulum TaxID=1247861 RepID=A0AB34FM20_9HYPO|nr:fungal zn(2)-Cys(6) binuclear cluster domain-containing protein [Purpureocillium lavendulum]